MDLSELIVEFRRRTDDATEPYLTSDEALARMATEAQKEACARARLLYDDTSDFTTLAVAANTAVTALDPRIDRIIAATFTPTGSTSATELDLTGMDWLREQCDWATRSCSRPYKLVHLRGEVRLWPTPSVAGTLQLAVYRLPLSPMEADEDTPEIDGQHHDGLVDWMVYKAYQTKDGEQGDRERSQDALALFEARFGTRDSADVRRRQNERRRVTTRPI